MALPSPAPPGAIAVLVADDHPLIRAGVRAVLATTDDLRVVGEARDGREAVARYAELRPDVVLMDLRMPEMGGVDAIRAIRALDAGARVVALTTYDGDADIRRALEAGAAGYLLKDMLGDEVLGAVRAVRAGRRAVPAAVAERLAAHVGDGDLTPRELDVLGHLARGLSNREIAAAIGRTDETVKMHLKHVFEKLGVGDRVAAVAAGVRRGLVRLG
jgi:two-component system NarL family response regulator